MMRHIPRDTTFDEQSFFILAVESGVHAHIKYIYISLTKKNIVYISPERWLDWIKISYRRIGEPILLAIEPEVASRDIENQLILRRHLYESRLQRLIPYFRYLQFQVIYISYFFPIVTHDLIAFFFTFIYSEIILNKCISRRPSGSWRLQPWRSAMPTYRSRYVSF